MSSFQLRIDPFAEYDMQHAKNWYNDKSDNLGNDFMIEVEKTISQMLHNPYQFPRILSDTRKAVLYRFPYTIFYKIGNNTVDVYAVFHNSQNPVIWKRRIK
jgi:plasmid stabilization system protein ParE